MALQAMEKKTTQEIARPMFWEPFAEMERFHHAMNRLFADFFGRPTGLPRIWDVPWLKTPAINLYQQNNDLVLEAALPGFLREEIQLNVTADTVTLRAEHKAEKKEEKPSYYCCELQEDVFSRTLRLPNEVNPEKVKAEYVDGVLKVRLPMLEPERHRSVKVAIK